MEPRHRDPAPFELGDNVDRCPDCGRFVELQEAWVDHDSKDCARRRIDECACELASFCSQHCADRFHQEATQ